MPVLPSGPLVSTDWLAANLSRRDVRVLDCRWYLRPFDPRQGVDEYRAGHIPGALHVTWDSELADPTRPASMLAPRDRFATAMSALGIGDDTLVVTYDDHHVPVAARVRWALRVYGHDAVSVLDGGITRWVGEGRPTSTGDEPAPPVAKFTARFQEQLYATKDDVLRALASGDTQLLDARMNVAFDAATGHIPSARRLVGLSFLEDGERWVSPEGARKLIAAAGVGPGQRALAYCGGGVAATATALAFELAGYGDIPVYDGSWTEWDLDPATPKVSHAR